MTKTIHARDVVQLSSRRVTSEGYLIAPATLARTGVQLYRAYELGLDADGMDPMHLIRLHRPDEEVFSPESMASFENKPVTIDHPSEGVTADNWTNLAHGEVRSVNRSGQMLAATVIVKSREAIDAIEGGKVELSNGYTFELDLTPGQNADGERYDGVQRNIRGNHVALVDAARCGSACRIADSQPNNGANTMPDAKRKVVIDGIPLEVEDAAAGVIETLNQRLKDAADKVATTQTQVEKLTSDLAAKDAQIEELRKDVMTPEARDAMVAEWVKLIGDAKRIAPDVTTDGKTCVQIRREVIANVTASNDTAKAVADAILAGVSVEDASADAVRTTFNALAVSVKKETNDASATDHQLASALVGDAGHKSEKTELIGRDRFLAGQANGWQ